MVKYVCVQGVVTCGPLLLAEGVGSTDMVNSPSADIENTTSAVRRLLRLVLLLSELGFCGVGAGEDRSEGWC